MIRLEAEPAEEPSVEHFERRGLYVLAASTFTCFIGITSVMPLMPLYMLSLGAGSLGDAALWSGLALGVTPLVSASASPVWGLVADRYGYKPVIQRSLFGYAAVFVPMALVTAIWQMFALRLILGLFAGFSPQAMGMASTLVPRHNVTAAIGLIQVAQIAGASVGPLLGGVVADHWGFSAAFIAAGALNAASGVAATIWLSGERLGSRSPLGGRESVRAVFALPGFIPILLMLAIVRMAERSIDPLVPLLIVNFGLDRGSVGSTAGLIISTGTLAITVSTIMVGRFGDRIKGARLLKLQLVTSAIACLPFMLASTAWQLAGFRLILGVATGGTITLALAFAAKTIPAETRGAAFGILGSATLYGGAFGMIGFGGLASLDLRLPFVVLSGLYLTAAVAATVGARQVANANGGALTLK